MNSPNIIVRGFNLPHPPTTPTTDEYCQLCAAPLHGHGVAWKVPTNFTDGFDLGAPASSTLCADCATLVAAGDSTISSRTILGKLARFVANEEGAWKFSANTARAWLFHSPPATPFLACISQQKSQHLIWRTPPTLDPDLIVIRLGSKLMNIRRRAVLEAAELLDGKPFPYVALDRDLQDGEHGRLKADLEPTIRSTLQTLTPHETWAMSCLISPAKGGITKLITPVEPERIEIEI